MKVEVLKLRDGEPERLVDLTKPLGSGPLVDGRDLLKEVAPERIIGVVDRAIRLANELRNEMEVANAAQEVDYVSEVLVLGDLFERCLSEPHWVPAIVGIGSAFDFDSVADDDLSPNDRPLLAICAEYQFVRPLLWGGGITDLHTDADVWVGAGCEASDALDAAAAGIHSVC